MDLPSPQAADVDGVRTASEPAGEWRAFLARMLRHPRTVGAIAPSSEALAQAMLQAAQPLAGPVLELGAGTGVFSRALLRAGLAPGALYVVERLPEFAAALSAQLPGVQVLALDAAELKPALFAQAPGTVISGLPLRAMRETQVEAILRAVLAVCREDACIVQFSYGLRCPVSSALRARLGLRAERMRWVPINLPPAWVWRLQRVKPSA
ncbi:MAG: phospholipid methyltransferase [Aquimonas sp.]|nr:phospholipid methyltransferase [Aquimonas sp.]